MTWRCVASQHTHHKGVGRDALEVHQVAGAKVIARHNVIVKREFVIHSGPPARDMLLGSTVRAALIEHPGSNRKGPRDFHVGRALSCGMAPRLGVSLTG